jgi:DNA (cytosine-5)-methyltransferase 1
MVDGRGKVKVFSLFSGIGGFEIPMIEQGWEIVGHSEIDKYANQVYEKHFPGVKNYGDIRKINPDDLPDFDLLCGGFPCQSFSIAGKRGGIYNDRQARGTLFFEIIRIAKAKRPRIILLENVKGLLSNGNGFGLRGNHWPIARYNGSTMGK